MDDVNNLTEDLTTVSRQEKPTLSGFLEEVALIADIDNLDQSAKQVMLMTLHSAKGLEFPIVYMTGLEDGLFPGYMSIVSEDPTDLEEERRLCYVGITRAQKELNIRSAKMRMVHGETQMNKITVTRKGIILLEKKIFLNHQDLTLEQVQELRLRCMEVEILQIIRVQNV